VHAARDHGNQRTHHAERGHPLHQQGRQKAHGAGRHETAAGHTVNIFDANTERGRCKHRLNLLKSQNSKIVVRVDDELELSRRQDRQVGGLGAVEDFAGIDASLTTPVRRVSSVAPPVAAAMRSPPTGASACRMTATGFVGCPVFEQVLPCRPRSSVSPIDPQETSAIQLFCAAKISIRSPRRHAVKSIAAPSDRAPSRS
jgi:hypothetical protein